MSAEPLRGWARFQDLVFSVLQRYRPAEASWAHLLFRCAMLPGMVASLFVRGHAGPRRAGQDPPGQRAAYAGPHGHRHRPAPRAAHRAGPDAGPPPRRGLRGPGPHRRQGHLRRRRHLGRHPMVGANSVVLSDVPDYAVVLGVPARQVGNRKDQVDRAGTAP